MPEKFEFQITEQFHRKRLDEFLFNEFRSLSKAYLRRIVKEDFCEVNGFIANTGTKLKQNDFVEIRIDPKHAKGMRAEELPLEIVFEDSDIIVIDKPHGILVHPTNFERNGTLLNGLIFYLNQTEQTSKFIRPHLIHRLDRDTSGLILIGKNERASRILCGHFKKNLFEKKYLALVEGRVLKDSGEIDASIGRDASERKWKVMPFEKDAHTRFRVLERFSDRTLLELEPVTGRTNQLRIHCHHIGHPILGDRLHTEKEFQRLCLHASGLGFRHPSSGRKMQFVSSISFPNAAREK